MEGRWTGMCLYCGDKDIVYTSAYINSHGQICLMCQDDPRAKEQPWRQGSIFRIYNITFS